MTTGRRIKFRVKKATGRCPNLSCQPDGSDMTFVSQTRVHTRMIKGMGKERWKKAQVIEGSSCRPSIRIVEEAIDPIQDGCAVGE